ncbi:Uncharacterised protein [Mycobacteroides abscessus]|nr:Uncharacterised protein [Mycobacteroides abscessus]
MFLVLTSVMLDKTRLRTATKPTTALTHHAQKLVSAFFSYTLWAPLRSASLACRPDLTATAKAPIAIRNRMAMMIVVPTRELLFGFSRAHRDVSTRSYSLF